MSDISTLKSMIAELDQSELSEISNYIFEVLSTTDNEFNYNEAHVNYGLVCPICSSIPCVKNGHAKHGQRFLCRDCGKTFGLSSGSVIANTKLSTLQWLRYIQCMLDGKSIRESADIVGVCVKTSFYMRHKILDAIKAHMDRGSVSGIVEMDETFLAESFKGNHKKSNFKIPRKSRKRGKEVKKRGISSEQICIGAAIDKNGGLIMEMVCKGRITSKKLEKLFDGYVSEDSTICTDSYSSYKTLSKKLGLVHKRIPSGQYSDGLFNLSAVNSLHSRFKRWIRNFNGVSTKFLPNYLAWFRWLESVKNIQPVARINRLWKDAMAKPVDVGIARLRQRTPVWV